MSECKLDHSVEDVLKKLEEQCSFLPVKVYHDLKQFLTKKIKQSTLNEIFHLLKKYDLASNEDQNSRNDKMIKLVQRKS